MAETINTGTILFKDGTFLPDALRFDSEPCATGWRLVKDLDGFGLDRKIRIVGWRFFCIAGEIKAIVLGFEGQKNVRRAVKRMLVRLKSEKFNSLEITRVASKRFLGVPYVNVSARSRHIQESLFLLRDKDKLVGAETIWSRAGAHMSDLKFPEWQTPYLRALMETEKTKLGARLDSAQKAILLRMKSIGPECQEETQALEDALRGLRILKRERIEFQESKLQPFRRMIQPHMN